MVDSGGVPGFEVDMVIKGGTVSRGFEFGDRERWWGFKLKCWKKQEFELRKFNMRSHVCVSVASNRSGNSHSEMASYGS